MPSAIPVPVSPAPTAATSPATRPATTTAATARLFRLVATLAIHRTVPTRLKRHRRGLAATCADDRRAGTHARTGARTVPIPTAAARACAVPPAPAGTSILFSLPARFAAPWRGVAAFLEKLLFTRGEHEFLTAVAAH